MSRAPAFEDPRAVLARHGLLPKRRLSQNFLVDQRAVEAIARAAAPAPGATVVELGPGLGTLTAALLRAGAHVIGVERDPDMLRVLGLEFAEQPVELLPGDAASLDYAQLSARVGAPLSVAGNLPYAVTGAILRNLIEQRAALAHVVVMLQREVRDRLVAAPGSAEYGALTVFTCAAFEVQTVLRLRPGAFHPRPKVESAVVQLTPRERALAEETPAFQRVVRAAFQSRRKTLRNALGTIAPRETGEAALARVGIDPTRRGETLAIADFAALAAALDALDPQPPPNPARGTRSR